MLQRRGGSGGQLGGMRSTCPVRAGSPLIAVCQPKKKGSRGGGWEEDGRRRRGKEGTRRIQRGREKEEERRVTKKYPQY